MECSYCGNWESGDKKLTIQRNEKVYSCSLSRKNIGIIFNNDLIVSEYDESTQSAGVGVYSHIGDGHSIYALWSSTGIIGQLGSGIALKHNDSFEFTGEYSVQYFVGGREGASFLVKINKAENECVYRLYWLKDNNTVLHGIGFMVENSLAFAWGSTDCEFSFSTFRNYVNNGTEKLKRQTVTWDSNKTEIHNYTRV